MKYPLKGIGRDSWGNILTGEDINIYETSTSTAAKIYLTEGSEDVIDTVPQTTTDSNGYFSVWFEYDDYGIDQNFDIQISDEFTITDFDIFLIDTDITASEPGHDNLADFIDDRTIDCGEF